MASLALDVGVTRMQCRFSASDKGQLLLSEWAVPLPPGHDQLPTVSRDFTRRRKRHLSCSVSASGPVRQREPSGISKFFYICVKGSPTMYCLDFPLGGLMICGVARRPVRVLDSCITFDARVVCRLRECSRRGLTCELSSLSQKLYLVS